MGGGKDSHKGKLVAKEKKFCAKEREQRKSEEEIKQKKHR